MLLQCSSSSRVLDMKSCELEFLIRNPVNQYKVVRERLGAHCRHKGVVRGGTGGTLELLVRVSSHVQLGPGQQFFDEDSRPRNNSLWILALPSGFLVLPSESFFFLESQRLSAAKQFLNPLPKLGGGVSEDLFSFYAMFLSVQVSVFLPLQFSFKLHGSCVNLIEIHMHKCLCLL